MEDSPGTDGMANPAVPIGPLPWLVALGLIAAATTSLFALSRLEAGWLRTQPWSSAIRTEDYVVQDGAAIAAWSRELPLEQSVGESEVVAIIQQDLARMAAESARGTPEGQKAVNPFDTTQMLDLSYLPRASLVMLDLPSAEFEPLLATGRLPEVGKREILAGSLLSDRDLDLDGARYTVVGRLRSQVRGFVKTYVLPLDEAVRGNLTEADGWKRGSVVVDGIDRLDTLVPELFDASAAERPVVHLGPVPTRPIIAWGVWLSLLSAASGASLGFITLLRWLARSTIPVISSAMRETVLWPRLFWGLHIFLFGAFFAAMAIGMRDPELNHLFTEYASHTFTDGGLKYVGDAYQSGDIPRAAHATFHNNFVMQTLLFTSGSSLVVPLFTGVVKTLASFVVVGFAMAPLWAETASGMSYHVLTLVLELPPYVLAAFGVSIWSIYALRFLWSPIRLWYLGDKARGEPIIEEAAMQLPRGLLVLAVCTALSGLFLYVAAWYEAATLILFR